MTNGTTQPNGDLTKKKRKKREKPSIEEAQSKFIPTNADWKSSIKELDPIYSLANKQIVKGARGLINQLILLFNRLIAKNDIKNALLVSEHLIKFYRSQLDFLWEKEEFLLKLDTEKNKKESKKNNSLNELPDSKIEQVLTEMGMGKDA